MYVDAKPMSMFAETQGWRMPTPSPQPSGSLKRPPLLQNGSSSSSLQGMEQSIPSFQNFVKRTPPLDNFKPLPPTPLIPRRASSSSPPRSRTPSLYTQRRSSSVYSRTVSQWFDDDSSWRSMDLRDDPVPDVPPLPTLQPVAYSRSTPQLVEKAPTPPPTQFLQPRTYSPLIVTPSPTASRATTPERSPARQASSERAQQTLSSVSHSVSPPAATPPKKQLHMVSLEKAKAAVNSPGAVHLLPEELRAQNLAKSVGKSRSHEPLRVPTMGFFQQLTPPKLPEPPTLVDQQGRHRSLREPNFDVDNGSEYPFPTAHHESQGSHPDRAQAVTHQRKGSQAKVVQALGLDEEDEPRGRTRQRGPRSTEYSHYLPPGRRRSDSASPSEEPGHDSHVAREYHSLLAEQYRQPSTSPGYNSDNSIRAHMKMVPQPLFQNKPPAQHPGAVRKQASERSESPFHLRVDSVSSMASDSGRASIQSGFSGMTDPSHERLSTSGSIPISPPVNMHSQSSAQSPPRQFQESKGKPKKPKKPIKDDRVSMYYPYVGSRKTKDKSKKTHKTSESAAPPIPLLSAGIAAQRAGTPEESTGSSPSSVPASGTSKAEASARKESNASSNRLRTPLFQRLAGNTVKYADKMRRRSEDANDSRNSRRKDSGKASSRSPHLLPSPVKSTPPTVHLGWSEQAKSKFDRARSSLQSASTARNSNPPQTPQNPHFMHIATPARPLDESRVGLREPESPGRKGSIFGGFLDSWKERKREDRREELKKTIRIIPQGQAAVAPGMVRQASMGPTVQQQSSSRPNSGMMARRMSAFGWM